MFAHTIQVKFYFLLNNENQHYIAFGYFNYVGDYLSDFSYTSTAEIDLTAEIVYQKSSLELCSVLCSTADNFNCKSFDFCANSSYCLLSSDFRKKPSNSTGFIKTDTCANYKSISLAFK